MKALDLFCGLGGFSDGLALEGFEVLGVEIEPKIAKLYKHPVIVADVMSLNPEDFRGYDLIVGSPPCRDFSQIGVLFRKRWKSPPDPEGKGMELVNAFVRFVKVAEPRFWLMENVPRLQKYYEPAKVDCFIGATMRRCFWGNFPPFLIPRDYNKGQFTERKANFTRYPKDLLSHSWISSAQRARIPLPVARALGKAIREALSC